MRLISEFGRRWSARLLEPPARFMGRLGLGPMFFTVLGLALGLAAGAAFAFGRLRTGAALILAAGAADMLDGAVARVGNRTSRFGAFFDSVADRYSESGYLAGLVYYYAAAGHEVMAVVTVVVLSGSLLVSYAKARAESLGARCDVGLLERPERMVLLALGYLVGGYGAVVAMVFLAVFSHVTALQRIVHTRRVLRGPADGGPDGGSPRT